MKNIHIAIIISLVCAGCGAPGPAFKIPIPEHAADYSHRKPIGEESLGFLEVGSTKREEVLLTLGIPEYTYDHERAFVYQWDTASGVWVRGKKSLSYKTYELFIVFDDIGIMKGFEITEEKGPTRHERLF